LQGANAQTIEVREGEGFDAGVVERHLRERIEGLPQGELEVRQFPSGASNLTYLLRIGEWEGVLRRPPLGPVPPKAHDMGRESRILASINPHFPLAPKPYFFIDDESVMGAPFYVMERKRGLVIDGSFPTEVEPTSDFCRRLSETVVDTLVRLHAVDWEGAGLGALGRPEGFLERQVRGWIDRYEKARTEDVPEMGALAGWLARSIPESPPATIVHNDYKLNNLVLDVENPTRAVAVLDWEMTTVGDPLFDLAVSLSYWVEPDDPEELRNVLPTVTYAPGFLTRREFIDRYGEKSGRDVSEMHFYLTLGYFKLAAILQQIYARWKQGQTKDERFARFGKSVGDLIRHAQEMIRAKDG
jgi:aminoglycoside phosphotransferase (APT) family kinase protein